MKTIYVTFQIKPTDLCKSLGIETKYHAIKCSSERDAQDAASDINSIDGVSYIRINTTGKLRRKDRKIILYGSNYIKELY